MATARMTMIGLFNSYPDTFSGVSFPEGIDRSLAINSIVLRCGEAPLLYPNPDMMQSLLTLTANKWYSNIERMLLAIDSEYNPIYNYDRHEEWHDDDIKNESTAKTNSINDSHDITNTETHDYTVNGSTSSTSQETNNIESDKTGTTSDSVSKTTQNDVSAFNDSNYQPSDKTTESGSNSGSNDENITTESTNNQTGSGTTNQRDAGEKINRDAGSNTRSETGNNTLLTDNDLDHNGHLYGNIGVTTTQQMINEEMKLRQNINIYDVIAEIFFKELCIYVY